MKICMLIVLKCIILCQGNEHTGLVDLSWPYDNTAKQCPGDQDFEYLKKIENKEGIWYALNTFAVAEHCGTHIDAPYHFNPDGITVEKIPLEKLLVTGVLIDASKEKGDNVNYTMPLSKIEEWEQLNGPLPDNSVVIIKFGWSSRYNDKDAYLGKLEDRKKDSAYRHPGIKPEVADYLINSKKVVGVGVDCSSVDPGYDDQYISHVKLTKAGLYILENVALIEDLPPKFHLIVAPMKLAGGTGGPVRLIAMPLAHKHSRK